MVVAQFVYKGSLFPLYALVLGFSNGTHRKLFCCSQTEGDRLVQLLQESSGKDVTIMYSSGTSILSVNVAQVQSDGTQDGTECVSHTELKYLYSCLRSHIFGYLVVHKSHLNNGTPCSVVTRILVLTSVCLHVVKEDYVRWPLLPTMGMLPNWDRYQVERSCFLSHIQGVAVSSPASSSFCVVMMQADGDALAEEQLIETASMPCNSVHAASVEWQFVAASYLQRENF